jgi:hypothetical protein
VEADPSLHRNRGGFSTRQQHIACSGRPAYSGTHTGAFSAARYAANRSSNGGSDSDFGSIRSRGGLALFVKRRSANPNVLAIGGGQFDKFQGQMGSAPHTPATIGFDNAAFETGPPLGNNKSIHHERLVQCGEKTIPGLIVIGRKCFANADGQ